MLWLIVVILISSVFSEEGCCKEQQDLSIWKGSWDVSPTTSATWSLHTRIPMNTDFENFERSGRGKLKVKKKFKKFLLPLLMAYKLKFFTLIPVLIGGLVLLVGATGLAGFFFALFAAVMGLKSTQGSHHR